MTPLKERGGALAVKKETFRGFSDLTLSPGRDNSREKENVSSDVLGEGKKKRF